MEEFMRGLLGDRITLTWLIFIIGFCGVTYSILYRDSNGRSSD
ncbi:hypothetical protein [Oscillatoria acuminata]|uniref:Uncharacterized protein n=1 Tax=Oscillatoria acuminata PCC 6304 TaxID=56110 RepID=K9TCX3_9CYAN|nr:hypothetical protein [Oscillatoria acuminata]AFY79839.1 hypothetical protein Oscil6304_0080 [Oscillatoria acuminata PCC 6304]